jgi:cyclopropane-fatty-acyl-phospholipid synthase
MSFYDRPLELGLFPDIFIRRYVRGLCRSRIGAEPVSVSEKQEYLTRFIESLSGQPLAIETRFPNVQHYEVPTEFFRLILGRRMKYSCCLFREDIVPSRAHLKLDGAEQRMLDLTCERAELGDGQRILELGCGWGSLALYIAERYPHSSVVAVSNSRTQKVHIEGEIKKSGVRNLTVVTADMNVFKTKGQFDRIVTVEMFEHMRNYGKLMHKVAKFLKSDGKLFVHIFNYQGTPYFYDSNDPDDWMARNFFAGGMMPSPELLLFFADDLAIEKRWLINGRHYQNTLEAWLSKMDAMRSEIMPLFRKTYGSQAMKFWVYWRVFFIACAEVFGYNRGNSWFVSHYIFSKR